MQCDDDEPLTFGEQLVIAVAPSAVAALIEHVVAPLVGIAVTPPTRRTKAKSRAAASGFAAFVRHERRHS
jgi:hypothetical protein